MMKSGAQFLHVRLCLIQIAHISLQKTSTMRKCICHYQVRGLIRGGILYKSDSVLKVNNLHLGLCFVETHIRITTLFLAQRCSCVISRKCMDRHSSCSRLSKKSTPATENLERFIPLADTLTGEVHRTLENV